MPTAILGPMFRALCTRRELVAKFTCPSCGRQKGKKEIENLKSIYGLGFEYVCSSCGKEIIHPPLGQALLALAMLIICFINFPGVTLIDQRPTVAFGLMGLSGVIMVVGFINMKPRIKGKNA
jgi:predicted RNA-binding Zn-ribbon protein involved in translation (DUF1610 family)